MAAGPRYRVPFRRRREGKTDYRKRLALLKSGLPRVVVRKSNKHMRIQIVEFHPKGDKTVSMATSIDLMKMGWKRPGANLPGAYLTGYLAGKKALEAGMKEAVLDIGLAHPHPGGRLFSALKGMLDAGIQIPHSEAVLPPGERISGQHMGEDVEKMFREVKKRIDGGKEMEGRQKTAPLKPASKTPPKTDAKTNPQTSAGDATDGRSREA